MLSRTIVHTSVHLKLVKVLFIPLVLFFVWSQASAAAPSINEAAKSGDVGAIIQALENGRVG